MGRRALLAFLSIVSLPGFLHLRGSSSLCAGDSFSSVDGCLGANPNSSVQHPTFFTGYVPTITFAVTPPWFNAGVKYPVGFDTTLALQDPSTATLPGCASYAASNVNITSAPCTLNGFDFTLHNGICLHVTSAVSSGTVTISNSHFAAGSSCNPVGGALVTFNSGSTFNGVFQFNQVDGTFDRTDGCSGGCLQALMIFNNTGNNTVQYSAFINTNQHDVQFNGVGTHLAQFNYIEGLGISPSHGDWIISNYSGTGTQSITSQYNTGYSGPFGFANATAFCYLTNFDNTTAVLTNSACNNDTWVSPNGGVSTLVELNPGGIIDTVSVQNNYLYTTPPSQNFFLMPTQTGSVFNGPMTCKNNTRMDTGATVTGPISSFGAGWVCS